MFFYLKKFWKVNLLAVLFQMFQNSGRVIWSLLMILLFQQVIELNFKGVVFFCVIELVVSGGRNVCSSLSSYFQSEAIRRMNDQLRQDMAASLLNKSYKEYHLQENGAYLSQFTNDVNQIEQLAWKNFYTVVGLAVEVALSVLALAALHWSILLGALFTAAVMILLPKLFKKKLETLSREFTKAQETAVGKLKDLLAGYDILCFFDRRQFFSKSIYDSSEQMEKPHCRQQWVQTSIGNGLDYISTIIQVGLFAWISFLSIQGIIIQSAAAGGGNLCGSVYGGLCQIIRLQLSFSASKPYFDKITVHAGEVSQPESRLPALQQGITVEDVSFCYDEKKPVLVHMDAQFKKGGKYALTGPSGCGKSTLLKILLGWLPEYRGTVRYDGQDVRAFTPEQLQQQMSYIEQDVFLFNTTIRENITLGETFTEEQLEKALRDSALAGDLAQMPQGLDTPVGEEGSALSGGQKQRVAIARALIHDRSILLVDEGTSALDQKNADIVEKSLLSNPDLTLILISHHLSEQRKAQFDQVYQLTPACAECETP